MEYLGIKNRNHDSAINSMRSAAQVAEKLGWAVGGYSTAFLLAGEVGFITFSLIMLVFASLQTTLIRMWDVQLNTALLRKALVMRIISFICLSIASINGSIALLLIGGGMSGLFVGLFWPTFYQLKKQNVSKWFVQEKFIGCFLCIISGAIIIGWSPTPILLASSFAALISYLWTFQIQDGCKTQILRESRFGKDAVLALSEGCLSAVVRVTRDLVMLTGGIVIFGLKGVISFALLISITEFLGAFINNSTRGSYSTQSRCILYCMICLCGTMITIFGGLEIWIFGILLVGVGSSALFPLTISIIRLSLESESFEKKAFREDWRNRGRLVGTIFAAISWFILDDIMYSSYLMLTMLITYLVAYFIIPVLSGSTIFEGTKQELPIHMEGVELNGLLAK